MNFYDDGTPVGLGLIKVAGLGALAGAAVKGVSSLGRLTARGVGKAGKLVQQGGKALGEGAIGNNMQTAGNAMRGAQKWVRQGNNAAKLGAGVAGAGALAAGGAAAGMMSGNNEQNMQQQQQY